MTDTDLIRRAQRGDEAAWDSLVRQHQERVFRLAYLLTGDADEAEDVAQEAFIRAFRSLDRFDADRPPQPWLLRITANLAHNRRRASRRYLAALRRMAQGAPEPVVTSAERRSDQHWEAEALWQAIRRLPARDQEVIYLRHFLELSVADTADALDVAEGTVKSRLHRALKRLKDVIEADYPDLAREVSNE